MTALALLGAVVRGLRARLLLSAGSVLLTSLAVGSAILGPSFQEAVVNSYAVTRLDEAPARSTGTSRVWQPATATAGGDPAAALDRAAALAAPLDEGPWRDPQVQLESVRLSALRGVVRFWARDGACDHLEVTGRCPRRPGEVLMLAADAETTGARIGEPLPLDTFEPPAIAGEHPRPPIDRVVVTGTYAAPTDEDFWFDPTRFASSPERTTETGQYYPYSPAPLLTVPATFEAFAGGQWSVRVDRHLDVTPDVTAADLAVAKRAVAAVSEDPVELGGGTIRGDNQLNDLAAVHAEVRTQQETARASVAPAVLSLVLVALALLMRLLRAASELRVPELALASLRGVSSRRLWALGLAEPLVLLLVSLPVGLGVGLAMAWGLTRWWLLPGLPVPLPAAGFVAGGAVLAAAVGVAVIAVGAVLRETLASQLTGVRRPDRSGRWATVAELVLVALAAAVLVSKLSARTPGDPDATDLVLPVLLAVVAGLGATRATAALARWWSGHRASGRSLSGFVSSRAISRRQEGTLVILPLTAAVAVAVFGAGVHDSAATWRHSVAATVAPAHTVWRTSLPLAEAVDLTHEIDPAGDHVMAAAEVPNPGASFAVVDAPRLPQVATWPSTWSPGRSVEEVARAITPGGTVPRIAGRRLAMTVDNRAETSGELVVEVRMGFHDGVRQRAYLGPFPPGTSTRSARLEHCADGCRVEGLSVAGGAGTTMEMVGRVVLDDVRVDGDPADGFVDGAGWVPSPDSGARSSVTEMVARDGRIELTLDSAGAPAMARLTAGGITRERAVARGVDVTPAGLEGLDDGYGLVPVDPVTTVESTPFLGPRGLLVDHTSFSVDRPVYDNLAEVRVLMDRDAPDRVRDALSAAGMSVETTLAREQRTLDQGAYALALRLYAVVAVLVMLMALAGLVVSTAVQLPARRRDAAALRVVGVPRRAVVAAVAREIVVVLGSAAVAGIAAGTLAQLVVLRTVTLGYLADLSTPHLVAEVSASRLLVVAVLAVVVLGVAAAVSGALTVRGARGATLRESAR
jgi:putative ABC transport system permease protein